MSMGGVFSVSLSSVLYTGILRENWLGNNFDAFL